MAEEVKTNKIITLVLALIIVIAAITLVYINIGDTTEDQEADGTEGSGEGPSEADDDKPSETTILTVSFGEEIVSYTLLDLEGMESVIGSGSYVKTRLLPDTVLIEGPYNYTGVQFSTILTGFDNLPENYNITITASDGWTSNYTKDQIEGKIDIYDETGVVVSQSGATMILAYKEDGEYITDEEIGPLRVSFIGIDIITASDLWSKMVVSIEVIDLS